MTALPQLNYVATSDLDISPSVWNEWELKQRVGSEIHDFINSTGNENETWQTIYMVPYEPRQMREDRLLTKLTRTEWNWKSSFPRIQTASLPFRAFGIVRTAKKIDQPKIRPCINVSEEDMVDWDFHVKSPSPRQKGTIKVRFHCQGRGKPLPVDDPWE